MRILLTGVSGQVGSAILRRFRGPGTLIPAGRDTLDLSRPAEIGGHLDDIAPDVILNPAAYTAVDRAEDERELAFTINAEAPHELARWAARRAVPLVHLSTDYVFNGAGERPWREDDATAPLNAYGASKLAGEQAVREAAGPHLILRTSWVYAVHGTNFLRTIARLGVEREELSIVADQIGSPTPADCIADVLVTILERHHADLPKAFAAVGGLVHVTAGGATSWHGFAEAILDGLRQRGIATATRRLLAIPSQDYPTKAARPLNSRLDLSRLAHVFGLSPPPWDELLERELDDLAPLLQAGQRR
jgi:dTDP-4-dehydrorhamnose reductase